MNVTPTDRKFSCLLVDDDVGFVGMLARIVAEEGGEPTVRHSLCDARELIARRTFEVAILDNRLPDGTGYEFHAELRRRCPDIVAVMITGAPELAQAVELTRNGLSDYLTKPIGASDFAACLRRARLRLSRPELGGGGEMVGGSPANARILDHLRQAARHPEATVLLLGETGTGKDLAARQLHRLTHGAKAEQAPFVAMNGPAVPAEMFEAELFGAEKGAYTGADRRRTGLVESAEGGTLFLDEVAEIPLGLQAKLLRFLENREYRSLGSTQLKHFTGRVVAATNRDLQQEVAAGRFREDLVYRLDVMSVSLPPLRERLEDLPALAEALLAQLAAKYGRRKPALRPADLQALAQHPFPGNVRELRNLLERSLLKTFENSAWLEVDLAWLQRRSAAVARPPAPTGEPTLDVPSIPMPIPTPFPTLPPSSSPVPTAPVLPPVELPVLPPGRELPPLEAQEYRLIAEALRLEDGGIRRAAARVGLTHQALLRRLQKWPELRQIAADL
jgi:two-component system response regulator AtoC